VAGEKYEDMFSIVDNTVVRRTGGQTDRQASYDSIVRTMHSIVW